MRKLTIPKRVMTESDTAFLFYQGMPFFNIKELRIKYSRSKKVYPDIWVDFNKVPTITVTDEWRRQSAVERKKRLTHELLHCVGMQHDERIGYSTYPARDNYSIRVYKDIVRVMR